MSALRALFFSLVTFIVFNLVHSTEFVPCFIWSNKRINDKVPALNKISQDVFKETIQKHLQDESIDLTVIFAEQTLSPEDFAHQDQSGIVFPSLAKLTKTTKVSYLPYVQNPIKALKHLDVTVTEVPLDKLGKGFEIPETDILIINLNDAQDNENRIDMLKRHDSKIISLYEDLKASYINILCIYTSHHTSWVASEEVVQNRQRRSLLEADETEKDAKSNPETETGNKPFKANEVLPFTQIGSFFNNTKALLYVTNFTYIFEGTEYNTTDLKFDLELESEHDYTLSASTDGTHKITLKMRFTDSNSIGYWEMEKVVNATITNSSTDLNLQLASSTPISVRDQFSFHCGDQVFSDETLKVVLKNYQLQLYFTGNAPESQKFDDAYDCVGFTSVPIWSGLFVTTILLIIMTIGITMMMDIRTMDKFDDAKGKTITINPE